MRMSEARLINYHTLCCCFTYSSHICTHWHTANNFKLSPKDRALVCAHYDVASDTNKDGSLVITSITIIRVHQNVKKEDPH